MQGRLQDNFEDIFASLKRTHIYLVEYGSVLLVVIVERSKKLYIRVNITADFTNAFGFYA
jgi:hypothetical protein